MKFHRDIIQNGFIVTLEIKANVRVPLNKDDYLKVESNAVMMQNMGPNAAILNEGWTVAPGGGVMSFGSQTDVNMLNLEFNVVFDGNIRNDNAPYPTNRLEIIELFVRVCDCKPCKNYME